VVFTSLLTMTYSQSTTHTFKLEKEQVNINSWKEYLFYKTQNKISVKTEQDRVDTIKVIGGTVIRIDNKTFTIEPDNPKTVIVEVWINKYKTEPDYKKIYQIKRLPEGNFSDCRTNNPIPLLLMMGGHLSARFSRTQNIYIKEFSCTAADSALTTQGCRLSTPMRISVGKLKNGEVLLHNIIVILPDGSQGKLEDLRLFVVEGEKTLQLGL